MILKKKQKIIGIIRRNSNKEDFEINKINFISTVFIIPLITFQVILSEFNGLSLTTALILSSVLVSFLIIKKKTTKIYYINRDLFLL